MTDQVCIASGWVYLIEITEHVCVDKLDACITTSDYELISGISLCVCRTNVTNETYDDLDAIIRRYNIRCLMLTFCAIGDVSKLMTMVANNSVLRSLDIDTCYNIDDNDASCIANTLSGNIQLTSLGLKRNDSIGMDGFRHIMKSLKYNTVLKRLELIHENARAHYYDITNIIIETIPHAKSLKSLSIGGYCDNDQADDLCVALAKNHSIEYFGVPYTPREYIPRIYNICQRNRYIRHAFRELLDIVIAFVPLVRRHGLFDIYCMMWIFDHIDVYNACVYEFKKIRVIRSVFEFYRRKIYAEEMSVTSLCL